MPAAYLYYADPARRVRALAFAVIASVVDLRYHMADVLAALDRREQVTLTSHGKVRGTIIPAGPTSSTQVVDHPFFGCLRDDEREVDEVMEDLRGGRFHAL